MSGWCRFVSQQLLFNIESVNRERVCPHLMSFSWSWGEKSQQGNKSNVLACYIPHTSVVSMYVLLIIWVISYFVLQYCYIHLASHLLSLCYLPYLLSARGIMISKAKALISVSFQCSGCKLAYKPKTAVSVLES